MVRDIMERSVYFSAGNSKIDKSCLVFSIPTEICYGAGKQCKSCYARKAEYPYKNCLPSRFRNYKASLNSSAFIEAVTERFSRSKKRLVRIHEAGDFYSQEYINSWIEIIKKHPEHKFYTYTKKLQKFDFSEMLNLPNMNLIDSNTSIGFNYGNKSHIANLERLGYVVCPCGVNNNLKCMKDCKLCLNHDKVCFHIH